jgi:hypothetical protein
MNRKELKPTNQALLLNQCHYGIKPQHTAITQRSNSQMFTNQALKHTVANTPIQRVVLTITDSTTEDKRHLAPKAN